MQENHHARGPLGTLDLTTVETEPHTLEGRSRYDVRFRGSSSAGPGDHRLRRQGLLYPRRPRSPVNETPAGIDDFRPLERTVDKVP